MFKEITARFGRSRRKPLLDDLMKSSNDTDTLLEDTCSDVNLRFAYFCEVGLECGSVEFQLLP